MHDRLAELAAMVENFGTAPTLEEMPRRTLADKGIAGPTAAHVVEEVQAPLNIAYLTFTTGSSAFQNIVGVTHEELPDRLAASARALELAGAPRGGKALFAYAPLVNVFGRDALESHGLNWKFLRRSSRDALILALCSDCPDLIVGESSFLRAALADAESLGFGPSIPRDRVALCAGTKLDMELPPLAEKYGWKVHDLYGCQEFGWLALNGVPLRDDISLAPSPLGGIYREFVVGGLPLADSFPVGENGHICNPDGKIITYRRRRSEPEYEVWATATPFGSPDTVARAARSILRLKGRVVKVSPDIRCNAPETTLELRPAVGPANPERESGMRLVGPEKTRLFDVLVDAQRNFQSSGKTDPSWIKKRN